MKTLLVLALMQVPVPVVQQDSSGTRVTIEFREAQTREATMPAPIIVDNHLVMELPDSVLQVLYQTRAIEARNAAIHSCGCAVADNGPPDLFWYGLIALGFYAVRTWGDKDGDDTTINVEGGDGGDATIRDPRKPSGIRPPDNRPPDKPRRGRGHGSE